MDVGRNLVQVHVHEGRPIAELDLLHFCIACDERPEYLLADLITPTAEKMRLDLDPEAGEAVYRITKFLRDRSGPAPEPISKEDAVS